MAKSHTVYTLQVISKTTIPANLLTGATHSALSTEDVPVPAVTVAATLTGAAVTVTVSMAHNTKLLTYLLTNQHIGGWMDG